MKVVLVGYSINNMLLQQAAPSFSYVATGAGWLALRYCLASHRHIYALQSGVAAQVQDLQRRQRRCLVGPAGHEDSLLERFSLLRTVGERTAEVRSRLAIDLIPGVLSVLVGALQLLQLLRAPRNWLCVTFLVASDFAHHHLCQRQALTEDQMDLRYNEVMADMYATAMQSTQYHETVTVFDRPYHEMERLRAACERMLACHYPWSWLWNVQGSLRHWVAHLQTGIVLWLSHGYLPQAAQLVMVLFYAGQVQRGLGECRNYQRQRRLRRTADGALWRIAPAPASTACPPTTTSDGSVRLEHVELVRGEKTVLHDICLAVPHGSRVAVLGGNGAGKTSLFRLLQRWHPPSAGAAALPPAHAVLVCTQEPQLFTNATVPYNVAYGCKLSPESATWSTWEAFGEHVVRAAAMLGVQHLSGQKVAALSGGERQRLGLARVLAAVLEAPQRLRLLLLDEYDSALDCHGKALASAAVRAIRQRSGCTVMTIMHTPAGVYDTAVVLAGGRIVQHGQWRETSAAFFDRKHS